MYNKEDIKNARELGVLSAVVERLEKAVGSQGKDISSLKDSSIRTEARLADLNVSIDKLSGVLIESIDDSKKKEVEAEQRLLIIEKAQQDLILKMKYMVAGAAVILTFAGYFGKVIVGFIAKALNLT